MTKREFRTDEQLMNDYLGGDSEAFEELFHKYRAPLFTFLVQWTGDRVLAEDLFQEAFLKVIRAGRGEGARGGETGSFRGWLFTVARNALKDWKRRQTVRRKVNGVSLEDAMESNDSTESSSMMEGREASPLLRSQWQAVRERLQRAISSLPTEQKEVFLLRERAGLDFEKIAKLMNCPLPTAKSRMRYALINLRKELHQDLPSLLELIHE